MNSNCQQIGLPNAKPDLGQGMAIIPPHGGFQRLVAYRKSEAIYQGTRLFCRRFLPPYGDRTVDQMMQAARSCKQNVAEGSATSGTSRETEIKLTGVARASLAELREDYLDYLVAHGECDWAASDPRKAAMRAYCRAHDDWSGYRRLFERRPAAVLCNLQIVLICQTRLLLERLLASQAETFRQQGGLRERMRAARETARGEGWEKSAWSCLLLAESRGALMAKEAAMHGALRGMAARIRARKGW